MCKIKNYSVVYHDDYIVYQNYDSNIVVISELLNRRVVLEIIKKNYKEFFKHKVKAMSVFPELQSLLERLSKYYIDSRGNVIYGTRIKWINHLGKNLYDDLS